jgi:antirestriction protein ArdC
MFGDKVYSFEELVAEISAVMLLSECGLVNDELKENSVEYVNGWVKQLEKRPEQILQAVQLSTKAVNYMKGKVKKK